MCYVIENFQPTFTHLRHYPHLRIIFFSRNIYKHFVLTTLFFNNLPFANWPQTQLNFFNNFFIKSFTLVTVSQLQIKSNPIKLNFPNSLQFWALTGSLFLYNQHNQFRTRTTITKPKNIVFRHQYYLIKKVMSIKVKQAPFKTAMLIFLRWVVTPWTYFNAYLKLVPTPLNFTPQLLFLKYINTYFFKVYRF